MESFRLKNIIILILLLTNLSLAAVVVSRQADHQEGLEQVRQQLVTLFAAENVELDEDLISSQTPPLSRTLTRDTQQEDDLAAFLLGENLRWSDQGGGIHLYGSDWGGVQFLDNGSFDAAGSLSEGASAPEVCRAFCKEFGYGDLTFSSDGTSATAVLPFINQVEMILVMTVEPGFGGQKFMADQMKKLGAVRGLIDTMNPQCELEVDGGIDPDTAPTAIEAGANVLVAGSAVYGAEDIAARIEALRGA